MATNPRDAPRPRCRGELVFVKLCFIDIYASMGELELIKSKIYEIRGQRVMLDFDLAAMYGVLTGRLNEQVKRNIERFPEDFMFKLTKGEWDILKSQNATSKTNQLVCSSMPLVLPWQSFNLRNLSGAQDAK